MRAVALLLAMVPIVSAGVRASDAAATLQRMETALTDVAERVSPCVVSIRVTPRPAISGQRLITPHRGLPLQVSQGSGVIIRDDGAILTNAHVIRDAHDIFVTLHSGEVHRAEVVGADMRSDLAVVRIAAGKPLPVCTFAEVDEVRIGQFAIALGNPFGLNQTITLGVVSATSRALPPDSIGRDRTDSYYGHLIQTDAAINPGNSGGPLVDIHGQVIGLNVLIFSRTRGGQGVGFAIPTDTIKNHLPYLLAGQPVQYGYLGLRPKDLRGELARAFGVPSMGGVLIDALEPGQPAALAGLQTGEVILQYDGRAVASADDLVHYVGLTTPGTTVEVEVMLPTGRRKTRDVRVGRRPVLGKTFRELEAESAAAEAEEPAEGFWRGLLIRDMNENERLQGARGVVVDRLRRWSPAARAGVELFDRVEMLGTSAEDLQPITSADQFHRRVQALDGPVLLKLSSGGFVAISEQ